MKGKHPRDQGERPISVYRGAPERGARILKLPAWPNGWADYVLVRRTGSDQVRLARRERPDDNGDRVSREPGRNAGARGTPRCLRRSARETRERFIGFSSGAGARVVTGARSTTIQIGLNASS